MKYCAEKLLNKVQENVNVVEKNMKYRTEKY